MMTMSELQTMKSRYLAAVCACSETGGLSLVEVTDEIARISSRVLYEHEQLLRQLERSPRHRELRVPYSPVQPRQQALPFARA